MAKTEPAAEQAPEPTEEFEPGGIVPAGTSVVLDVAELHGFMLLAQTEADNYARAHTPNPIKEE